MMVKVEDQTISTPSDDIPSSFSDRFEFRGLDLLCVAAAALLIWACVMVRGSRASEGLLQRPLRVGIVAWPGYAGGLVANNGLRPNKDSDFWKKHNLLVEFVLVDDEAELWRELARGGEDGGFDVIWSTVDSLAHTSETTHRPQQPASSSKGVTPRAFMQVDWSRGGDAIVASAGIKRIEDLTDKKIAVPMAASLWLLEYSLSKSSLSEQQRAKIRNVLRTQTKSSQEARDLFVDTKVDAAVLWEPDVTEALKQRNGAHTLVDTNAATKLIADVMVGDEQFIRRNPKVITAFIEGWLLDGTSKAINDPMIAVKVLRDEPEFAMLDEETVHDLLGKVKLATLDDNIEMFGLLTGDPFFDHLFNRANDLWSTEYSSLPLDADRVRDSSFLNEIYRAHVGQLPPGCGSEIMTTVLPVRFAPGKSELSPEARQVLDDDDVGLLLRTYADVKFSVDANADDEKDPVRALALRAARADAVIQYLMAHYNRRRSQFMSVTSDQPDLNEKVTQCIRLKLESSQIAQGVQNPLGSRAREVTPGVH